MSKWLVLPMLVLAYIATSATAAAPRDRDHDRMPDRWERKHHLSPAIPSAKRDPDGDRLRNRRELRLRTHPRRADTDGDRLRDGAEVRRFHTNPRRRDTDGDGFRDRCELLSGTNPRKRRSRPGRRCSSSPQAPLATPAPPGNATPAPAGGFPNPASTGVPAGWTPAQTRSTDLTVTTPGAVVEDIRFTNRANLLVQAPNVTVRRVDLQGGVIDNGGGSGCNSGLVVEDSTIEPLPGEPYTSEGEGVVRWGGYTLRRVEIVNRGEGPRVSGCAPVTVEDTFIYIKAAEPRTAECDDTHADGMQAYGGKGLSLRNTTIIFANHCGTSPYFMGYGGKDPSVPPMNKGTYNVDRLLVSGGGYVFRQQVPGSVTGLRIVKNWVFGPIDNRCSVLSPWEAKIVTIDANYQVTRVLRDQPCNTEVVE